MRHERIKALIWGLLLLGLLQSAAAGAESAAAGANSAAAGTNSAAAGAESAAAEANSAAAGANSAAAKTNSAAAGANSVVAKTNSATLEHVAVNHKAAASKPLRIVALAPHVVETLFHIGAGDLIIATTDHADYPLAAQSIPRVGNYARLQVEKIFALQPDYVIGWSVGNPAEDLQRLKQLGLTVIDSSPRQLADVATEMRSLGKLLHLESQAQVKALAFEAKLKQLQQTYQHKKQLRVFYELWPNPLSTVANHSWPQQILQLCGVQNAFEHLKGDYPPIALESVVTSGVDVIVQPYDSARPYPVTDWSRWTSIPAVANHAYVHPDADKLHRMTARMLDEASLFCQALDRYRTGS